MSDADFPFVVDDFTLPYSPVPYGIVNPPAVPQPRTDPAPRVGPLPTLVDRRDLPIAVGFDFLKRVFSGF